MENLLINSETIVDNYIIEVNEYPDEFTIEVEELTDNIEIIINDISEEINVVIEEKTELFEIMVSELGSQGIQGEAGNIAYFEAGEIIGGGRLLMLFNGKAYKFDADDEASYEKQIGFSINAALEGEIVKLVASGKIEVGSLVQDAVYYAAQDGMLSTSPVVSGVFLAVGTAINDHFLEINFSQSIVI
jgi:hypothetical protein